MKTFVLCGHNKCGTRWLAQSVKNMSGVQYIDQKKIRQFFSEGDVKFIHRLYGSEDTIFIDWPYAVQNPQALEFLTQIDEHMEAIMLYREPVDAMLSFHRYQRGSYRNGYLLVSGQKLIIKEKITDRNVYEHLKSGLLRRQYEMLFQYDKNLALARRYFANVNEFLYEDLLMDNKSTMNRICNILGCDVPKLILKDKKNVGMRVKNEFFYHLTCKFMLTICGVNTKHLVSAFTEGYMKKSLAYYLFKLNWSDEPLLTSQEVLELKKSYSEMVKGFQSLTSCNLEVWGYDSATAGNGNTRESH
jgi:hypothetical protein